MVAAERGGETVIRQSADLDPIAIVRRRQGRYRSGRQNKDAEWNAFGLAFGVYPDCAGLGVENTGLPKGNCRPGLRDALIEGTTHRLRHTGWGTQAVRRRIEKQRAGAAFGKR